MTRPIEIDDAGLHRFLYRKADRQHRFSFSQQKLAADLGVSEFHLCRVMRRLREDGRVRRIGTRTIVVADPANFTEDPPNWRDLPRKPW